ncbi:MAG TPA: threonine--tRNA ligase [Gemmatimonadaceae bacterium]|nr:threonine--tRNA ligase [Gemmatimonadaceae bacterium]
MGAGCETCKKKATHRFRAPPDALFPMIDRPTEELTLTLPDGSERHVSAGTLPRDVVASIGPGLARAAIAVEVNGSIQDLVTPLREGGSFRVLTDKDPRALAVLRHSAAHLLATAVRRLRPAAKIGFGPAIEDGFYYDFEVDQPFTPDDLAAFEGEMKKAAGEKFPFVREEVSRSEAQKRFVDDPLKLERLSELSDDEIISVYTDGPFVDLCRGPHVPDTSRIKHFRLLHTAPAYWRGDEHRQQLQRIYGTAWFTQDELDAYLHRLEEAKRRDHRLLGKELDLFSTDQRVGPGLILWHPRGSIIRNEIENFERDLILRHGYQLVYTPHIMSEKLFEISGHLVNFKEGMFAPMDVEGAAYRPKPMNCPGHICIYQSHQRSYRDLPLRYAEFGTVYRYERSGVLHGMLRVRGFTQDDAHVFCTPEQVPNEVERLLDLVHEMLTTFGYPYTIELSTRPENAMGSPEVWTNAECTLRRVLEERGVAFTIDEGGGAFYGPKLDFKLIDAIGRKWQGPTVQLDFNLPERFGLEYIGPDNAPHRPVMLHRVLVGSMERFVGGLIEHYAGAFPLWLAPEQLRVIPITDEVRGAAATVAAAATAAGLRASLDDRAQTLNYRIAEAERLKTPYMAIVGKREAEAGTVALREHRLGREQKPQVMPVADLVARLGEEVRTRALGAPEAAPAR